MIGNLASSAVGALAAWMSLATSVSVPPGTSEPPPAIVLPEAIPVSRVDTNVPVVALTFDACPSKKPHGFDPEIFEILQRERVPATVFMSGSWIAAHRPEAQKLADEPLIELGNHSFDHPAFSKLSVDKARAEIGETDRLILSLGRRSIGFRPPFGDWAPWLLRETDGRPVVLWDVVSGDAGGHIPSDRMIATVMRTTKPGSIVIFHINGNGPHTKEALPDIIRGLRDRGLRFVHVSELLSLEGSTIVKARPAVYRKRTATARGMLLPTTRGGAVIPKAELPAEGS